MPWKPAPRRSWGGGTAKKPVVKSVVTPPVVEPTAAEKSLAATTAMEEAARAQWSELMNVGAGGAPSAPTIVMGDAPPVEGITPPVDTPVEQVEYVELSDGTRILKSEFDKLPVQAQIVGRYSGITALRGELDRYTAAQTYKQEQAQKAWDDAKKQAETEKAARTQAVNIQLKNSPELLPYFTEIDDEIAKVTTVLANSQGDDQATIDAMTQQLQQLEDYKNALMGAIAALPQKPNVNATWEWDSKTGQFVQAPMGPTAPSEADMAILLEMDRVRTLFSEVFHEADVQKMVELAADDPETFILDMRHKGRSPEAVSLLKEMFPNITDDQIDEIYAPAPGPETRRITRQFNQYFPNVPIPQFESWLSTHTGEAMMTLQKIGRNSDTEGFLREVAGLSDEQIDDFFKPQFVGPMPNTLSVKDAFAQGLTGVTTPKKDILTQALEVQIGFMNGVTMFLRDTKIGTGVVAQAYDEFMTRARGNVLAGVANLLPDSQVAQKKAEIAARPGLSLSERNIALWRETNMPSLDSGLTLKLPVFGDVRISAGWKGVFELLDPTIAWAPSKGVGLAAKEAASSAARNAAKDIIKAEAVRLAATAKKSAIDAVDIAAKNMSDEAAAKMAAATLKVTKTMEAVAEKNIDNVDAAGLKKIAEVTEQLDTLVQKQELLNKAGAVSDNIAQGIDAKVKELEALTKDLPDAPVKDVSPIRAVEPVTSQAPAPAPIPTTEKLAGKTPIEQARILKDGLSADISVIRKRIADISISKVDDLKAATDKWNLAFSRTAANDADRLLSKVNTIIDRIERGQSVSEETIAALSDRIASLKDFYKHKITSEADVRARLSDYIKENLPLGERGRLLDALKDAKTEDDILKTISRVDAYAEKSAIKTLKGKIEALLEKTKPRKENGILKGRYTAEIQAELDDIRKNLHMTKADASKQIEKNVQGIIDGTIENIDAALRENDLLKYAGIDEMNSAELEELLDILKAEKGIGSAQNAAKRAAEELDRKLAIGEIVNDVNPKGIIPGRESGAVEALPRKASLPDRILNSNRMLWNLADRAMARAGKKFQDTRLHQFMVDNVYKPKLELSIARKRIFEDLNTKALEIFGVKKPRQLKALFDAMENGKVKLGTFKNASGVDVTLEWTKAEIMGFYQHLKNPELADTFAKGMNWTQEMKDAVVNSLTPQEKAWADHMSAFLQEYHSSINKVYRDVFNTDLPQDPFYWPKERDFSVKVPEYQLFAQEMRERVTATNDALKATTKNVLSLKPVSANRAFQRHINDMEFFKAQAQPIKNLRRLLADPDFRMVMEQTHGKDLLRQMKLAVDTITRQGPKASEVNAQLDWLRGNFSTAQLGLKVNQFVQQVPTALLGMVDMNPVTFTKGMRSFWKNPKAAIDEMFTHPYIIDRYNAGNIERDIKAAMAQDRFKAITNATSFKDILYSFMTMGDKLGTMQSYWAKYQEGLAKGLSKERAMEAAGLMSDRIQNTASFDTLTNWQNGGSVLKLMNMFQSQPSKYFQIMDVAVRDLRYGRGNKAQAATALVMAWAVMPAIFQYINDGFEFRKSRQLRAVVLGPINDLLLVGQLAGALEDTIAGEPFDYQATPVMGVVDDVQSMIRKGVKTFFSGNEYDWDAVIAFAESVMKPAGEVTGMPTPYLIQVEKAIRGQTEKGITQRDWRELVFSRYALQEPKPSQRDTSRKNQGLIGTLVPSTKADKEPTIFDGSDYFREQKANFSKNLLSDITEANGFDPGAEAVAKAIMAKETLDSKPNKPLYKIVDDMLNDPLNKYSSITEYYADWLTRQTLTSKADILAFDKTHDFKWGNLSAVELKALQDYEQATPEQRAEMLKDNPLLKTVPTDRWLKANPEENAYLAIMGQAEPLTQAAYNKAVQLAKDLGWPDSATEKFLPPKDISSAFFDYKDAKNTQEENLILAKNPMLASWLGRELITTPIPALELKVKNVDLDKAYADLTTDDERTAFRKEHPEWVADNAMVTGYTNKADDAMAKLWGDHAKLVLDKGDSTAEDKLWFVDHKNVYDWAVKNELKTDSMKDWNIPVLRIDAKYRAEDKDYDAIDPKAKTAPDGLTLREQYLKDNPAYANARRERDGYSLGLDASIIPQWVEYNSLPDYGAWRSRYRKEHPEFDAAVKKAQSNPWADLDDDIPAEPYDKIYEDFKDQFKAYDNVQGTEKEREAQRNAMFEADAKFKEAWYRREAYGKLFPDTETDIIVYDDKGNKQVTKGSMVDLFVRYSTQETFYGKQRLLLNNPEFDKLMDTDAPKSVIEPDYDIITKKYQAQFDELDKLKGDAYETRARELRFSEGKYTEFGIAEITRNAYHAKVPKNLIPDYVNYYKLVGEKEATNKMLKDKWQKYEDAYNALSTDAAKTGFLKNGTKDLTDMKGYARYRADQAVPNYEDDWFLMEHPEYYRDVYLNKDIFPDHGAKDFEKIPSREVFALYLRYRDLPLGSARTSYRRSNPDLEKWMVLQGWVQPLK